MAQERELKRRIRSVRNAKQITKALEVVAASRMRKVVGLVAGSRNYGDLAAAIMQNIARNPEAAEHPFLQPAGDKPTLFVILNSDRGQAGAFNSNIFNLATGLMKAERHRPQVVVFGRKGTRHFAHVAGIDLRGTYEDIPDVPDPNVFASVMGMIDEEMRAGRIGRVIILYTQFISSLSQKAASYQLLPIDLSSVPAPETPGRIYEFEPEANQVLDEAIRIYTEARLMQFKIESAASEQAMRMIAMGNANRNAGDLIDNLTLELNASRQATITQEIAEITGGAAAIAV